MVIVDTELYTGLFQCHSCFAVSGVATSNEPDIKVVTEKELATLLELIHTFSSQWDMIGTVLGFAPSELDKIKNMSSRTVQVAEGVIESD